ncbi:MAG TPA: HypC/HybG/HupF family hydrogenase formation chaperone [Baekduia sp.]|uniref:HypC/HybG/HupF family hydrogenase formation chaperone n=1 Tax=Baekduia sp. TaxID=2600305 RepID=UPI002D779B80|nr:HypC/HybG/HupF family hydrogenase formation chaperone [Baekduia sp.]HET6505408.1 HypC/HybG/HupF family hydrogenase formation chaperone [Baekduia sp.]
MTGCDDPRHCVTCGDDGTPETVLAVDEVRALALCARADGTHESVEILLVAPVAVGDTVLVHAGTALTTLEGRRA